MNIRTPINAAFERDLGVRVCFTYNIVSLRVSSYNVCFTIAQSLLHVVSEVSAALSCLLASGSTFASGDRFRPILLLYACPTTPPGERTRLAC